ncbi:transporter substrate-binding domain-containing protein [Humitalea sp. 24SJ18S-53]|uniref:transporter substrate-binding domain-containing protein n=1 Tax=Humitalea sp. 24SJ18S-53 TaxID=3422307 RepID=UPI003D677005
MLNRRQVYGTLGLGGALLVQGAPAIAQAPAPIPVAPAPTGPSTLERILASKKLRIAVVANQEPYFRKNLQTGQWTGFCLSMARDIAEQLGVELELLESTWGNSVLDLQSNKIDMAFGLNPTARRALVIDFPNAMFFNISSLVAKRGFSPRTWADLNKPEVRIAFDVGTSRETIVRRFAPRATHVGYRTSPECVLSVASGRSDVFACSVFLGLAARKQNPNLGEFIMPTPMVRTTTTAAIQYDRDGRFRQFINAWVDFNRGTGQVREWILASLGDMGIEQSDLPPDLEF